jgi:LCP family protein required for cell wall assembly
VVLLGGGAVAGYVGYARLSGNISHQDVASRLGVRPPKYNTALNILLIGSDTRAGDNASFGHGIVGARSDTLILLHISPHRDGATAISFPRDSVVQAPECTAPDGSKVSAAQEMINATFTAGGPACTWKTLEATTGIHIDHFIQVDFSGFKRMVDALGGVELCLPKAIDDPKSHLKLAAGRHEVKGDKALAYVRTRYSIGDGSDLGRIKRQQLFMASVVHKATRSDLVASPARLYGFLDAATHSITTDNGLSIGTLRKIADSVRGISSGKVRFVTVPNHYWEVDRNRVVWTQPDAEQLFDRVKSDIATQPSKPAHTDAGSALPNIEPDGPAAGTALPATAPETSAAPSPTPVQAGLHADAVSGDTDMCSVHT